MITVITLVILDPIIIVITGMFIVISFTITILMITNTTLSPIMVHAILMGVRTILIEIAIAPIAQVTLDLDTCVATTLGFA
jgi:hypothetical protein